MRMPVRDTNEFPARVFGAIQPQQTYRACVVIATAVAFSSISSCGSDSVGPSPKPAPASMVIVAGEAQSATVGSELPDAVVVRVLDSTGAAIAGQLVNFKVTAGGGTVFAGAALTNALGQAQERWTIGTVSGSSQTLEARAVDASTGAALVFGTFHATALAGPAFTVAKIRGDNQSGPASAPYPDSLVVKVQDQFGNSVNGVAVSWTASSGGGTVSPVSSTSDADGLAGTRWTSGGAGSASVSAAVGARPPVTFGASAYLDLHFVSVSVGLQTACGITDAGSAYCWGLNPYGALGDVGPSTPCIVQGSSLACSLKPLAVSGARTFSSVSTGGTSSCGISGGALYCWGSNYAGLLGIGSWPGAGNPLPVYTPTAVGAGLTWTQVAVGSAHACAVATGGTTYCWGDGTWGALGAGVIPDSANAPVAISGGLTFSSVTAGEFAQRTCGLTVAGAAYCWGSALTGAGDASAAPAPRGVAGGLTFVAIASGNTHTCGLVAGGAPYCWGQARLDGDTVARAAPFALPTALRFLAISAGFSHTCALTAAGAAYCWGIASGGGFGSDFSAIGDGTTSDRLSPVAVSGGHSFAAISAGLFQTCAVETSGKVYCWGFNGGGQLGNGTTVSSTQPVLVTHP